MSDLIKLARPYAKAAFQLALADSALAEWDSMLIDAKTIAANTDVRELISNPGVSQTKVAGLLIEAGADRFTDKFANLLKVLAENDRLSLLPEISAMFRRLKQAEEKQLAVKVVSAVALSDDQKERMQTALAKRFDRNIELNAIVDSALIGGAVIHAGDMVIDGSLRGELNKLAVQLAD